MDLATYIEQHWMGMFAIIALIGVFLWVNFKEKIR
jgi:flagellar biogenesis protein FliO